MFLSKMFTEENAVIIMHVVDTNFISPDEVKFKRVFCCRLVEDLPAALEKKHNGGREKIWNYQLYAPGLNYKILRSSTSASNLNTNVNVKGKLLKIEILE